MANVVRTCLQRSLKEKKATPLSARGTKSLRPPTLMFIDFAAECTEGGVSKS
jgi:hypothetical protein